MSPQQILTAGMTHIAVDKNTDHAKPHSIFFFFYHNIKDNKRNLRQDLSLQRNIQISFFGLFHFVFFNLLVLDFLVFSTSSLVVSIRYCPLLLIVGTLIFSLLRVVA